MKKMNRFVPGVALMLLMIGEKLAWAGNQVPEIPAGFSSFLLVGMLGAILWLRNFFGKK